MAIETNELVDVQTLTPFKKFIMSIGAIPTSYLDSMTYAEMLAWFCNYLQNTVIPTVNNNGEAVEELQGLYEELITYVNEYFENLNVQEEINNKLDSMAEDGSLTTLISAYIDPFISQQNSRIDLIDQKVDSVASGSPLVASSTSGMTETDRVYVNTTDGKWYYYDGDSWKIGGTYQATELNSGEVKFKNLDSDLKQKISLNITNYKDDFKIVGKSLNDTSHILVDNANGEVLRFPNDDTYILKLSKNVYSTNSRTYFTAYYCDGVDGTDYVQHNLRAFFKSSENPIMLINPYDEDINYIYYLIQPKTGYDYYFINIKTINYNVGEYDIYKYDDVKNEVALKIINGSINDSIDYEFKDLRRNNFIIVGFPYWQGSTFTVGDITGGIIESNFTLDKGRSVLIPKANNEDIYVYKAINNYVASFDENFSIASFTKESSVGSVLFNTNTLYKWKITSNDAKWVIPIYHIGNNDYECHTANHDISNTNITSINGQSIDNRIPITNWYTFGDSITNKNGYALKNYIDWICQDLNIINTNYAKSGMGYKKGVNNFIEQVTHMDTYNPATDIITVMGSINDMEYVPNDLGELGDTTTDTLYGCFYTFFNDLITKFNGLRIGIISPITNIYNNENPSNMDAYLEALENTAKYFNIPYLNLYYQANLRPWDEDFLDEYYDADGTGGSGVDTHGTHPNSKGHQLFYARIREFIKTL